MPVPILDGVVKETKSHPYTMLALVGLLIAVPYLYENSASADDLKMVQAQLTKLDVTVNKGNLEQRLGAVETELFSLKQKIADKVSAHQTPDPLYYDRVSTLEIMKDQLERELAAFK